MSAKHGLVVRTWCETVPRQGSAPIRWYAVAEAVPEGVARAVAAGGDLPDTAAARAERTAGTWAVESATGDTEAEAVLEAVRLLMARGLGPQKSRGSGEQ